MRRAELALVAVLLAACGGEKEPEAPEPAAAPTHRVLRDVLDARLAERGLEVRRDIGTSRELRDDTGVLPPGVEVDQGPPAIAADARSATADVEPEAPEPPPELDPDLVEFREGMIELVLSTPDALERARGDIAGVGEEMVVVLARPLSEGERPAEELKVLIDLAAGLPHADLAAALCDLAAGAEEPWLRRYAVWALEFHRGAEGADVVVPRLLLRMKYEADGEALGWILRTLWGFGSGAALDRARARARTMADPTGRASLEASLAGYESLEAPAPLEPSAALIGETWLWLSDLSGAHFQLRGVDDARYVLSSLGPWAAEVFAEALEDDDDYVRLHTAQVLERMGERGRPAMGSLIAALEDPSGAVRGEAAEALVAVAGSDAEAPLLARLGTTPPPPYEDRVALARGLAQLPEPPAARLRELFDGSPGVDLRLACAAGLLRTGEAPALDWLLQELREGSGDPAGAEATLQRWLEGDPGDVDALLTDPAAASAAWKDLGPQGAIIHDAAQARERRRLRAEALEATRRAQTMEPAGSDG